MKIQYLSQNSIELNLKDNKTMILIFRKMKSTIPEISIIVCCYNHEKWIERCLRSIFTRKY